MISADANSSISARVTLADKPTHSVESVAGFIVRAVLVVLTHHRDTGQQRISLCASRTHTLCSVRLHVALRPLATLTAWPVRTRIQAVAIDTGLVIDTVRIRLTLRCAGERENKTKVSELSSSSCT